MKQNMNMNAIISLIMGVGVAAITLILVLSLGGQTYALNEETFDAISTPTTTTETYLEDFQPPDVSNSNPSATWYSYTETWDACTNANVSNTTTGPLPGASNQTFRLHGNTTGGSLYSFTTETTYDSLETYVMVTNSTHKYTIITIGTWIDAYNLSGHGAIAYWNVTNDTCYFYVLTGAGPTYTEVYNHSISVGSWYRLRATFDYDTYAIASTLESVGVAGTLTQLDTGSQVCVYEYTNITRSYWAMPNGVNYTIDMRMNFDNFKLTDSTTTEDQYASDIETGLKESVISAIRGISMTGTYLPIIVLSLIITIVLGLIFAMGVKGNTLQKRGGGNAL